MKQTKKNKIKKKKKFFKSIYKLIGKIGKQRKNGYFEGEDKRLWIWVVWTLAKVVWPTDVQMYEEIHIDLNENTSITSVSHSSLLNCLFVLTSEKKLIIYDCNSNVELKKIDWSSLNEGPSKRNLKLTPSTATKSSR